MRKLNNINKQCDEIVKRSRDISKGLYDNITEYVCMGGENAEQSIVSYR